MVSGIRRTVLRGLISESIDLIRLLLLPSGRVLIGLARRLFLNTALLGLRRRWRNAVRLGFLAAAALSWGLRRRRWGSSLTLWSAARRLRGGLCCHGGRGALLGGAGALSRWPAGSGVVLVFDIELEGLIDCMSAMVRGEDVAEDTVSKERQGDGESRGGTYGLLSLLRGETRACPRACAFRGSRQSRGR